MLVLGDIELFNFIFYVGPELHQDGWMLAVKFIVINFVF